MRSKRRRERKDKQINHGKFTQNRLSLSRSATAPSGGSIGGKQQFNAAAVCKFRRANAVRPYRDNYTLQLFYGTSRTPSPTCVLKNCTCLCLPLHNGALRRAILTFRLLPTSYRLPYRQNRRGHYRPRRLIVSRPL